MDEKDVHYTELPVYSVHRKVYLQKDACRKSGYARETKTVTESIKSSCGNIKLKKVLQDIVPITEWLPKYSFKRNFMGDLIAGLTIAVLHIPQGMAYGLLAGVTPSVGLYMAFFPVLSYVIFGTSRHVSMGTFAIVSLMTSKIVGTYAGQPVDGNALSSMNGTLDDSIGAVDVYTPMQVVTAVSFAVGILHFLMCFFRLGMLSSLLSEPLVNGFTSAAAIQVLVSQLKDVLGIDIPRHKGAFKIIYTLGDIFKNVHNTNSATLLVCVSIIVFMFTMNEFVKPWMAKKCRFPIPSELMAVVGGTTISYILALGPNFNVNLVGNIPVGLPAPQFPPVNLIRDVIIDSIAIAIVSYSIVMSMGILPAKKHGYIVRPNQELFALGISNFVSAIFSCVPTACSLARTLIQDQTGGKTQIASVVSATVILILLLWIGPFFETLPRCVLSGVIIVALKGMFMQIGQLKRFYKEGTMEALIWGATFFGVIIIDIDIGLLLGVILSLGALYNSGWKSHSCILGQIEDSGVYVNIKHHRNATEVPQIKVFQYTGSINFATGAGFKKCLFDDIEITVKTLGRASAARVNNEVTELQRFKHVIIDLSSVAHIDSAGSKTLTEVQKDLKLLSITLYLACPSDRVYEVLKQSQDLGEGPFEIFTTVHDGVLFAQSLDCGEKEHV